MEIIKMSNLSTVATFDDLYRCMTVLADGLAEEEFLKFAGMQEQCRIQWLAAVQEAQRLQRELDSSCQTIADLESKLFHARKLIETEHKARKDAEQEREQMEKKILTVAEFLKNERDIKDETKDKFAFLSSFPRKRKSNNRVLGEKYGNDINSTGSFLSDLSLTQSEDDFLDMDWKKHRPSHTKATGTYVGSKRFRKSGEERRSRRSHNNTKSVEIGPTDKIVAQTKVSIPQEGNGPIRAESTIEAIPQHFVQNKENEDMNNKMKTIKRKSPMKQSYTPTAPPLHEINVKSTPTLDLKKGPTRQHNFRSKSFLKSDACMHCQKKIRFGSMAAKCRDCRISVHNDCRELLTVSCTPQSVSTPILKGTMGLVGDYAPQISPMIPALIVHCVNEIETRGLNEIGIYRVSGSERDVKALKERFLRGKGVPFLGNIDVHVLCGCIKDFLRSLREPLIPTDLWRDFSNAVQNMSLEIAKNELLDAIQKLPPSNRDTLAFLILHFQRVAQCVEIKMPIANIARVFGPTIVGYSSPDPDQHAIFTETMIQFSVMESLMNIPTDYWTQYVRIDSDEDLERFESVHTATTYTGTPVIGAMQKRKKFYATPPRPYKKK